MDTRQFWKQLTLFISILLLILITREYVSYQLINNGIESYQTHTILSISANLILILVSLFFINKNGLYTIAGLKGTTLKKWYLLVFPLIFLVVLNLLVIDPINTDTLYSNIVIYTIYSMSIGFAEELSIRGFMQSHLINYFGQTKKSIVISIFIASAFFGVIHLINFDKGFYGEMSQVCFATFIGVMFGVLLVITKRIYPLILVHTIIDFVADLDTVGMPITEKISDPTTLETAIIITLLAFPCLLYAVFLMKKQPLIHQNQKL